MGTCSFDKRSISADAGMERRCYPERKAARLGHLRLGWERACYRTGSGTKDWDGDEMEGQGENEGWSYCCSSGYRSRGVRRGVVRLEATVSPMRVTSERQRQCDYFFMGLRWRGYWSNHHRFAKRLHPATLPPPPTSSPHLTPKQGELSRERGWAKHAAPHHLASSPAVHFGFRSGTDPSLF
jgi:hypothetical protein